MSSGQMLMAKPLNVPAECNLVLIKNIPTNVYQEDMEVILNQLGKVKSIQIFPSDSQIGNNPSKLIDKICFVSMEEPSYNWLLLNLNGLSFGNDQISVELCDYDEIPTDDKCLDILLNKEEIMPVWPSHISTEILKSKGSQKYIVRTINRDLELNNLPPYPDYKVNKIDEAQIQATRKTISVTNLKSGANLQDVLDFFDSSFGEILKGRKIENADDNSEIGLLIEFVSPESIVKVLKKDPVEYNGIFLNVEHSIVSIIDPTEELRISDQEIKEFKKAISKKKSQSDSKESKIHERRSSRHRSRSRSRSPHRHSRHSHRISRDSISSRHSSHSHSHRDKERSRSSRSRSRERTHSRSRKRRSSRERRH